VERVGQAAEEVRQNPDAFLDPKVNPLAKPVLDPEWNPVVPRILGVLDYTLGGASRFLGAGLSRGEFPTAEQAITDRSLPPVGRAVTDAMMNSPAVQAVFQSPAAALYTVPALGPAAVAAAAPFVSPEDVQAAAAAMTGGVVEVAADPEAALEVGLATGLGRVLDAPRLPEPSVRPEVAAARQATDEADRAAQAAVVVGDMQRRGGRAPWAEAEEAFNPPPAREPEAPAAAPEAPAAPPQALRNMRLNRPDGTPVSLADLTDAELQDVAQGLGQRLAVLERGLEGNLAEGVSTPAMVESVRQDVQALEAEAARRKPAEPVTPEPDPYAEAFTPPPPRTPEPEATPEPPANASPSVASVEAPPVNASAGVEATPAASSSLPQFASGQDVVLKTGVRGNIISRSSRGPDLYGVEVQFPDGTTRSEYVHASDMDPAPPAALATPAPAGPKFNAGQWVDTPSGAGQVVEVSPGRVVVEVADGTELEFTPDRLALRQSAPEAPVAPPAAAPTPAAPQPLATGIDLPAVDQGRFPRGFSPMYVDDVGAVHGIVDDRGLHNYEVIHPSGNRELVLTGQRERGQAARAIHDYVGQGGDFVPWNQYRGQGRYAKNERGFWGKAEEALPSTLGARRPSAGLLPESGPERPALVALTNNTTSGLLFDDAQKIAMSPEFQTYTHSRRDALQAAGYNVNRTERQVGTYEGDIEPSSRFDVDHVEDVEHFDGLLDSLRQQDGQKEVIRFLQDDGDDVRISWDLPHHADVRVFQGDLIEAGFRNNSLSVDGRAGYVILSAEQALKDIDLIHDLVGKHGGRYDAEFGTLRGIKGEPEPQPGVRPVHPGGAGPQAGRQGPARGEAPKPRHPNQARQGRRDGDRPSVTGSPAAVEPQALYAGTAPRRGAPQPAPAPAPPRPPVARPATAAAPAPSPRKRGPVPEVKSPQQLARDLAKILQTRIQYGRMAGVGSKAPGRFHVKRRLIEAAKSGDLSTIYHETGHAIDINRGLTGSLSPQALQEFERLADPALTPGTLSSWKPGMSQRVKQAEGLAEFIRGWFEDQTAARQANPAAAAEFEVWLDRQGEFGRQLRKAQHDYHKRITAPAQARIRASIVYDQPGTPLTMSSLITSTFDQFHALQTLSEAIAEARGVKTLPPSQDPYVLARLTKGAGEAVEAALGKRGLDGRVHGGIMDPNTFELKPGTKSLMEILEPIADDVERSLDFVDYLVARRAEELHGRGLVSGFDPADVQQTLADLGTPDFQALAKQVYQWNDDVLQYAVDGGFLSGEAADAFRALNQNYVPFHRLFELGAGEQGLLGGGMGKGLQGSDPSSFKKLRGSAREVVNPIESMIKNVASIVTATEKNRVALALAAAWDANGERLGDFFREVRAPQQVTNLQAAEAVKVADLKRELQAMGVDLQAAGITDQQLRGMIQSLPDAKVGRAKRRADAGSNTVTVKMPDGKVRFFELAPEVYRAYSSLNLEDVPPWVHFFGTFAQGLRVGTTVLSLPFLLRNPLRDSWAAHVVSRVGSKPLANLGHGLAKVFSEDLVREWQLAGGGQSMEASLFNHEGYKRAVTEVMASLSPAARKRTWAPLGWFFSPRERAGLWLARARKRSSSATARTVATAAEQFLKSPIDLAARASEQMERLARLSEYERAKQHYRTENPSWSDVDVRRRAAFESRDLMDFAMSGDGWVRFFRRIIPFYGAALTGNYRLLRALRENPRATVARGLFSIGGFTLFLYAMNKRVNPENYDQLPQRERDTFWHIPVGTGPEDFFRLPKPFLEGAIFGTGVERLAQFVYGKDPQAFDGYVAQLLEEILPVNVAHWSKIPGELAGPAGKLAIELGTNYDYFRQRGIVPDWMRDDDRKNPKPAWMESNEYTTAFAKALSKLVAPVTDVSPMMVDHAISGLTGTAGMDLTRGIVDPLVHTATGEDLPKARPRKWLGFGYTENISESEDRFWKLYKRVGERVNGVQGLPEDGKNPLDRLVPRPPAEEETLWGELQAAAKEVKDLRKQLRDAEDEDERRRLLDDLRRVTSEFTPAAGPARQR
jgi:hypothetical protein